DEVALWKQRILERKAKGQTIIDWCKEHNVTKGSYNYWRRQVNYAEDASCKPDTNSQPITFAKVPASILTGTRPVLQITWQDVNIQLISNQEAHLAAEVIAHLRNLC
ncbi:MAG: IS66 family insertion sequence element accessory protein TnpA, partial [Enterobacterales bacterium]